MKLKKIFLIAFIFLFGFSSLPKAEAMKPVQTTRQYNILILGSDNSKKENVAQFIANTLCELKGKVTLSQTLDMVREKIIQSQTNFFDIDTLSLKKENVEMIENFRKNVKCKAECCFYKIEAIHNENQKDELRISMYICFSKTSDIPYIIDFSQCTQKNFPIDDIVICYKENEKQNLENWKVCIAYSILFEEISLTNNFQSTKLIQTDYNESSYHVRKIYAKKPSSKISKKENSKPQTCSTGKRYTTSYIKGQNISKKSFNYIVITLKNILKQQKL